MAQTTYVNEPVLFCFIAMILFGMLCVGCTVSHAEIMGFEAMPESPYVLDDAPVTLLLSKSKYPAEDLHLDVLVWLQSRQDGQIRGDLEVLLSRPDGNVVSRDSIETIPGPYVFFSLAFPDAMAGGEGVVEVIWRSEGKEAGRANQSFAILPSNPPAQSGRIEARVSMAFSWI